MLIEVPETCMNCGIPFIERERSEIVAESTAICCTQCIMFMCLDCSFGHVCEKLNTSSTL